MPCCMRNPKITWLQSCLSTLIASSRSMTRWAMIWETGYWLKSHPGSRPVHAPPTPSHGSLVMNLLLFWRDCRRLILLFHVQIESLLHCLNPFSWQINRSIVHAASVSACIRLEKIQSRVLSIRLILPCITQNSRDGINSTFTRRIWHRYRIKISPWKANSSWQ